MPIDRSILAIKLRALFLEPNGGWELTPKQVAAMTDDEVIGFSDDLDEASCPTGLREHFSGDALRDALADAIRKEQSLELGDLCAAWHFGLVRQEDGDFVSLDGFRWVARD